MIETFSGNSYAQQGEREYQKRGCCSTFEEINWCLVHDKECTYDRTPICRENCEDIEERLRCTKCGTVHEV